MWAEVLTLTAKFQGFDGVLKDSRGSRRILELHVFNAKVLNSKCSLNNGVKEKGTLRNIICDLIS